MCLGQESLTKLYLLFVVVVPYGSNLLGDFSCAWLFKTVKVQGSGSMVKACRGQFYCAR